MPAAPPKSLGGQRDGPQRDGMAMPPARADQTSAVQIQAERARVFRALHEGPAPLLLPNPWDVGSARLLASLGFAALATTSGGFAAPPDRKSTRLNFTH